MARSDRPALVGVFTDPDQAERAVANLYAAGFATDEVGIMRGSDAQSSPSQQTEASEEVAPGTIAGTLAGLGIPDEEAQFYEGELKSGRAIVTVQGDKRSGDARRILRRHGAYDWTDQETSTPEAGDDERTMELREERLVPSAQWREAGEVVVRRVVEEVPASIELDATHEEIDLQRVPVGEVVDERRDPWMEDDLLVIPIYEEQLVVSRRLVLREQLRIRRIRVTEHKLFQDTLRQERVVVEDPNQTGQVHERFVEPETGIEQS